MPDATELYAVSLEREGVILEIGFSYDNIDGDYSQLTSEVDERAIIKSLDVVDN